ncbi:MAG TPA: hypothetical protein VIK73_00570 [Limnochordales bacterium]
MMPALGFVVLVLGLSWYEIVRIRRYGGTRREIVAYVVATTLAAALGVAMILGRWPPNPAAWVEALFRPLNEAVLGRR